MEAVLMGAAGLVEATGLDVLARGGVYPWTNVAHVLGAILLVGAIGIVDARIAGAWSMLPLAPLERALTPAAVAGLAIMLASGLLLFAADAPALATSATFHLKLWLVAAAIGNALFFRWRFRAIGVGVASVPAAARALAVLSLALWAAVVVAGRMIAYT
ncbi:hypothetical protein [Sphingomonas baiyangensis]|uniref:DUF2214 domain-containing protein n=1 Tax=Sphingomonas baiyangensis TaxID=2572576 RepID=A0A4U1L691_9SPHN|nr:hypothetical protein [Sphingomonas baiyangensis]TKD51765.1 hypothetical protein FBR43_14130 [Sphingomonas baiyangensis]